MIGDLYLHLWRGGIRKLVISIFLDNVASLLHLPITWVFHNFEALHVDEVILLLVELLEVSSEEARVETV